MSTILDALRRAQGSAPEPAGDPGEDDGPQFPPQSPAPGDSDRPNGRSRWALPLVVVVGLGLGFGAARMMIADSEPPPAVTALPDAEPRVDVPPANTRERPPRRERAIRSAEARAEPTTGTPPVPVAAEVVLEKPSPPPIAEVSVGAVQGDGEALPAAAIGDAVLEADDGRGRPPQLPAGVHPPPAVAAADDEAGAAVATSNAAPADADGDGIVAADAPPPEHASIGMPVIDTPPPAEPSAGATPPAPAEPPAPVEPPEPLTPTPPLAALDSPPDDMAPLTLLFVQWSQQPVRRVATVRSEGGSIVILREGDLFKGMRVAQIRPAGVEFHYRQKRFLVRATRH